MKKAMNKLHQLVAGFFWVFFCWIWHKLLKFKRKTYHIHIGTHICVFTDMNISMVREKTKNSTGGTDRVVSLFFITESSWVWCAQGSVYTGCCHGMKQVADGGNCHSGALGWKGVVELSTLFTCSWRRVCCQEAIPGALKMNRTALVIRKPACNSELAPSANY